MRLAAVFVQSLSATHAMSLFLASDWPPLLTVSPPDRPCEIDTPHLTGRECSLTLPLSDEQELMELVSRPEESLEFDSVSTHA
jgi:hypothetical protein